MATVYQASYVSLHVRKTNRAAIALYRDSLGFEVHEVEVGYCEYDVSFPPVYLRVVSSTALLPFLYFLIPALLGLISCIAPLHDVDQRDLTCLISPSVPMPSSLLSLTTPPPPALRHPQTPMEKTPTG